MLLSSIEIDPKCRRQIAVPAAFVGAGLAVFGAVHVSGRANLLIAGSVGDVLSLVESLTALRIAAPRAID